MKTLFLRRFRIFFSAIVFIGFFIVFVDLKNLIPTKYINILLSLQFIPSILKYFDLRTIITAGFIAVIILTLLTGRTYCSFLCPLGIGQDLFSRIGGQIRKKFRRYGYKKPFTVVRYTILALTVIISLIWGVYMLTLLDPYSIFGRFMTYFVRPVFTILNNLFEGLLAKFDIYSLMHVPVVGYKPFVYIVPAIFALLIGVLSLTKGRLYCNMICPVGTLLGLFSKISLLRIRIDENKCTRCGRCAIGCKSSCIDFLKYDVDVTRCVDCFNCIKICPDKAISYNIVSLKSKKMKADPDRRKFVAGALLLFLGMPSALRGQEKKTIKATKESTVKEDKTCPVCPPGGISIENFQQDCTACSLCISNCPTEVLQPAWLEYGITGIMQPVMDYHRGFCNYNCTRCIEVCPTNALHPLLLEAKKLTQLGQVHFIKDNCIVKNEKTACGACSESCPTKAVYMVPYEGDLVIPETNPEICIGCGQCEYSCPTTPFKAIFVDGNPVHQVAKKPVSTEPEIAIPEEFPF